MSLRRNLTESLEKLSSEIRRGSLRSPVYSCIYFVRCCRGWIRLMNQHIARSKPVRPVSTNHSIYCARSVEVGGKGGMGPPCGDFSGGSIHEVRVRYFSARQRNVGAVEVRPLPILARFVADDVGEPPARTDLEAYGAAV